MMVSQNHCFTQRVAAKRFSAAHLSKWPDGRQPVDVMRLLSLIVAVATIGSLPLSGIASAQTTPLNAKAFQQTVAPFFKTHCLQCHGANEQNADRRFDTLRFPIVDDDSLIDFQDALDQINVGEMPPEDEAQPKAAEKRAVINWLTAAIKQYQNSRQSTGGETVLRRLNRREYLNTISDLFSLNTAHFDPTSDFPADQEKHHLDNQGKELVMSSFLLQQQLHAAGQVINKALPIGPPPKPKKWQFDGGFKQGEFLGATLLRTQFDQSMKAYRKEAKGAAKKLKNREIRELIEKRVPDHIRLYEHPRSERHVGSYGYISEFADGVPHDGFYEITLQAEAKHRIPPYKDNFAETRTDEPLTLAIVPGIASEGLLHLQQKREPELARFELPDDIVSEVRARIWLDRGVTPRFIYVNGSHQARRALIEAAKIDLKANKTKVAGGQNEFGYGIIHSKLPQIRIHSVSIEGPLDQNAPSRMQQMVLAGSAHRKLPNAAEYRTRITSYLRSVWRRPIVDADVNAILAVIKARSDAGIAADQAYRDGLAAALCLPSFLVLDETPHPSHPKRINDHSLAARLSYFLWSSTPDETLTKLASAGRLSDPKELNRQVDRMLADTKSDRFVRDFLDAWLDLGALGSTPPDMRAFRQYYADDLQWAMKEETFHYIRHVLDKNLPIDRFIDGDFTFVNAGLARYYGMKVSPPGREFQQVRFSKEGPQRNRGGLLSQPSVLTVSANGVDTSPIVRGVWILENILGTPPNAPPPDIEPLDPDTRGATTIRELLDKHRTNATCAACHRKIDPLGFALENFDAIGQWRTKYRKKGGPIDATGTLPGGKQFQTFPQFKRLLLTQREKLARAVTRKLFSYALGRSVEISDRPEIDSIIDDLKRNDWTLRYLIRRVVLSPAFQTP